jgi:hypothetical protein
MIVHALRIVADVSIENGCGPLQLTFNGLLPAVEFKTFSG